MGSWQRLQQRTCAHVAALHCLQDEAFLHLVIASSRL